MCFQVSALKGRNMRLVEEYVFGHVGQQAFKQQQQYYQTPYLTQQPFHQPQFLQQQRAYANSMTAPPMYPHNGY